SFLAISHGTVETGPDDPRAVLSAEVYSQASAPLVLRSIEAVRGLFDGFDLIEPGLVWISQWRPGPFERVEGGGETLRGGVARKAPGLPQARDGWRDHGCAARRARPGARSACFRGQSGHRS